MDDYEKLGKGTWVGHLLECAGQVTGDILPILVIKMFLNYGI